MSLHTSFVGSIPVNYDKFLGPVLFEPYAQDIAERLSGDKLHHVLEVACGTGRVTNYLQKLMPPDGQLIATDLNADMIELAKSLVPGNIQWQVADVQKLPFHDKSFDHVVCQFGVMFFPNKQQAFHEVYRVLQHGGKFIFNTWEKLEQNPGTNLIRKMMDEVLKENAPDFLHKVPFSFYDEEEIRSLLNGAGFKNIELQWVNKTSDSTTAANFVKGYLYGTPLAAFLNTQDAPLREKLEKATEEQAIKEFGEQNVQTPMQAIVCTATK